MNENLQSHLPDSTLLERHRAKKHDKCHRTKCLTLGRVVLIREGGVKKTDTWIHIARRSTDHASRHCPTDNATRPRTRRRFRVRPVSAQKPQKQGCARAAAAKAQGAAAARARDGGANRLLPARRRDK